jgi:hypothetical protein
MRFTGDTESGKLVSRCFRDSLANSIATEFRSIPLRSEQRDILVTSFLLELYEVLGGKVPFSGRNGPIYAVLTLTTDNFQMANAWGEGIDVRLVTDHTFFDEAQVDLLFHIVDMLDTRFLYLGWAQDYIIRTISSIALGICRILDGSVIIQNVGGGIRPSLAFSRMFSGEEAITAGRPSWMQQYVAGVVPKYFFDVHQPKK